MRKIAVMTLTEYLQHRDITAVQLAAELGIDQSSLSRIIRGDQLPRKPLMRRIYQVTDGQVTPNDIFGIPEQTDRVDEAA